jgi:anti-sigma regulatory factor (Ser/Thr protein kinase)
MRRKHSELIERHIARRILEDPTTVTRETSEAFGISRQAAHRHIQAMVQEGLVAAEGATKARKYRLLPIASREERLTLADEPREDEIWRQHVADIVLRFPENIRRICNHGFTEMFNNAVDHSEGAWVTIRTTVNAAAIEMYVRDDGVGIFRKIQHHWNLIDEREALFQLTKGKLTTDPSRHSGEGIFFTSRMFDAFSIGSGALRYQHEQRGDAAISDQASPTSGTEVRMRIFGDSTRTTQEIFDQYAAAGDSLSFSRTHLRVQLLLRQHESLLSRSQGKRLLAGVEGFREVLLDFDGVDMIGQAFADEVFRVFPARHPGIELTPINAAEQVVAMICRSEGR